MAYRVDIVLDQGTDTETRYEFFDSANRPISFRGFSAQMQVRRTATSETVIDDLTTEGTPDRIGFCGNLVTLKWPREVTQKIKAGRYVYDLEVKSPNGNITRLMEGAFVVKQEVTR